MRTSPFANRLVQTPSSDTFDAHETVGLAEPVRRYFAAAIAPGTVLARSARFDMRGSIKIGRRWLRFRASQVQSPHRGFIWTARVGGVIAGYDRYADRAGAMDWRLFGLVRVAHGEGPDVTRSAAGRAGAEAVWVPTALLPRYGVTWTATDESHITAAYRIDDTATELQFALHSDGRVASVAFDRWGDPDNTGRWDLHPFGFEATAHATLAGVTIPAAGRAGWHFGTERWAEGEFFRCRITSYQFLTSTGGAA